jgi:light-regulated signal transduction histidine kinase (bacteriophytochrome)
VEIHLQLMREEGKDYFLIVAIDITERKKIKKALEDYAEDCRLSQLLVEAKAEELAEVNQRLKKSEKELKQLNSNKDKFLYIMAHDLRSPFSSLLGSAQFLENYYDEMKPEEVRNFIHNINYLAKNFRSILDDLLDWSTFRTALCPLSRKKSTLKK